MDIVPILLQLVLVVFLIFMNGFFVAAEFACVKIRPSRLETLIQEGSKRAAYAKRLTDHLDASLSVTQLGITLASGVALSCPLASSTLGMSMSVGYKFNDYFKYSIFYDIIAYLVIIAMVLAIYGLTI